LVTATNEISSGTLASPLCGARLIIGLGQGFALWALFNAVVTHSWPSTNFDLFGPAWLIALFVPVTAVMTLGSLRPFILCAWLATAALFLGVVGLHEVARGSMVSHQITGTFEQRAQIYAAVALALFIAQALVAAADGERRIVATYSRYFDVAWKQEVQLLLALLFLGMFWGVIWLGAALFHLIGIDYLENLISRASFAMPASTLAFACALHLTDIQVALVQGMRNLLHILLAWLLPLAAMLILAFIVSLPFTGLELLWRTSRGSEIVLSAAAVLVVLINTAYRDGTITATPTILRWTGSAAALCLPVLVAISAYGLALRVDQRGWTESRIIALACVVIGACYAVGYAGGAVVSARWLKWLEATNVGTAGGIVLVIVSLTAIADPARLSVMDQVARLEAGRITAAEFDFKYLRFEAARYGRDALDQLKHAAWASTDIKQKASNALALTAPYGWVRPSETQLAAMPVFPRGQMLPQSFVRQNWAKYSYDSHIYSYSLPSCLSNSRDQCEAFVTTAPDDGQIIIVAGLKLRAQAEAFALNSKGTWDAIGALSNTIVCESVRQALRTGEYRWVAPRQMDLDVGDQRLSIRPEQWDKPKCR
jgi:hypothetical protein